jgi:hypothetical protein
MLCECSTSVGYVGLVLLHLCMMSDSVSLLSFLIMIMALIMFRCRWWWVLHLPLGTCTYPYGDCTNPLLDDDGACTYSTFGLNLGTSLMIPSLHAWPKWGLWIMSLTILKTMNDLVITLKFIFFFRLWGELPYRHGEAALLFVSLA